jgi:glucosamine 6-phosphate synthetase-like amidotransferase/phosphosugar isomerase protein
MNLEAQAKVKDVSGTVGIGHTRWATTGNPMMSTLILIVLRVRILF